MIQLSLSRPAYLHEDFEQVIEAFRPQMPQAFSFQIFAGPVVITTERDEPLARKIIAALESLVEA